DDLDRPVEQRHAPWPFHLGYWIKEKVLRDLAACVTPAQYKKEAAATQAVRRFLQVHPEIVALTPLLLDRGDPQGREFVLRVALMAQTPEMLAALRDFAFSQRGPDPLRVQAA